MDSKSIQEFYNQWTKLGYPKTFNQEKDGLGKSFHQDSCEVKDCENDATIQLYDSGDKYLDEEFSPIELICKKHFSQEKHLTFVYQKVKGSDGETRPKYVELK